MIRRARRNGGRWLLAGVLLAMAIPALAVSEDELIPPDQAFAIRAEALGPDLMRVSWDIADGYYMYQHRFKFRTDTPGARFDPPLFPPGKRKTDEFFGDVEIYRDSVNVEVPVIYDGPIPASLNIIAESQGCADAGICYTPHTQTVTVSLPAADDAGGTGEKGGLISQFKRFGNSLTSKLGLTDSEEFLPPDQAFVLSVDAVDGSTIKAHWDIADGYYLYRDKFGFDLVGTEDMRIAGVQSPAGKMKEDEAFGRMEVYYGEAPLTVALQRNDTAAAEVMLETRFQGCADDGFCYPPMTKVVPVSLPAVQVTGSAANAPAPNGDQFVSEQDRFAQTLAGGNLLAIIAAFYGVGLLLAFTPCVLPMVPILSSIIVGQGSQITTRKAFTLSLAYVLPMAAMYTAAGIVAGFGGANLQAVFQDPWIIATFSAVFVALALSMFGFYDLQMPASWQAKLSELSNRQEGGSLIGAAVMGLFSALIVGPCVAAPLAGALIYIGQSGDAVLGGFGLLALSLGMGTPLLLVGTSAGRLLPGAGAWMTTVKAVFGVGLLGLAIWMLERILPAQVTMLLWAVLLIISAVYLGALRRLEPEASGWSKLWQGFGVVLLVYGTVLVLGAASGGRDVFRPLEKLQLAGAGTQTRAAEAAEVSELPFQSVKGVSGLDTALKKAAAQNRPAVLDFYADWCVECKRLEKYTFSDPDVQAALGNAVLLRTDVTANDDADQELLARYGLFGPPTILFFDTGGQELSRYRIIGFMEADEFRQHVQRALN